MNKLKLIMIIFLKYWKENERRKKKINDNLIDRCK